MIMLNGGAKYAPAENYLIIQIQQRIVIDSLGDYFSDARQPISRRKYFPLNLIPLAAK